MILGLSTPTFDLVHVLLNVVGVASGLVVVYGLLTARRLPFWTALFLISSTLAVLTGFLFPFHGITMSIELGILELCFLMLAAVDRYSQLFAGVWRHTYVVSVMVALFCNVSVQIAQIFAKFLAPTARTPWEYGRLFKLAELAAFAFFAIATYFALKRFHNSRGHRL